MMKLDLERHYLNILYRFDMMVEAAEKGQTVIAGEINRFGSRRFSDLYYSFIGEYWTGPRTGLHLPGIVVCANGNLAHSGWQIPLIHARGAEWRRIGTPSFDEFKSWYQNVWCKTRHNPDWISAIAKHDQENPKTGYNYKAFAQREVGPV
jgi:hypothetical protein